MTKEMDGWESWKATGRRATYLHPTSSKLPNFHHSEVQSRRGAQSHSKQPELFWCRPHWGEWELLWEADCKILLISDVSLGNETEPRKAKHLVEFLKKTECSYHSCNTCFIVHLFNILRIFYSSTWPSFCHFFQAADAFIF